MADPFLFPLTAVLNLASDPAPSPTIAVLAWELRGTDLPAADTNPFARLDHLTANQPDRIQKQRRKPKLKPQTHETQ